MFAAMRNGLGGATQGMRARGTVGLFVFEFFVVVLGVLAAQGLQEWAKQREQQRHVDRELERLSTSYSNTVRSADVWRSALPCLRTRIEFLMRAAATGTQVNSELIRRPRFIKVGYPGTDMATEARIYAILGREPAKRVLDAQTRAINMDENMEAMLTRWEKFRLLDPTYGPVSAADRGIAREAGADLLMHMRTLEIAIVNIDEGRDDMRIAEASPPAASDLAPVISCAQLWADGKAYRLLK